MYWRHDGLRGGLAVWCDLYTLGYRQLFPPATREAVPSIPTLESTLVLHSRPRYLAWKNSENGSFSNLAAYRELFEKWKRRNDLSNLSKINQNQMYGSVIRGDGVANILPFNYAAEFEAQPENLTLIDKGAVGSKFCVSDTRHDARTSGDAENLLQLLIGRPSVVAMGGCVQGF
ncbi:MAG: hypothetical protein ACU843_16675 [Gammaproteobacteria bacterium]